MVRNSRLTSIKRLLAFLVFAFCLLPATARAAGIADILTLIQTITSTLQNAIGGALSGIQTLNSAINNFRQQTIWPVAAMNQAKASVTSTIARYRGLMSQIQTTKNNSATLANPSQLESIFRNGHPGAIAQLTQMYTKVYAMIPPQTDAR